MKKKGFDLRDLLDGWDFHPENNVRLLKGSDGRDLMQVRTPLGVEQYELEGRPDGQRPHGAESALDYHRAQQQIRNDFALSDSDCAELFEEGTLYYFRYVHLFQIKEWARTIRDTERNLALFDFIRRYAAREEQRVHLEQWRPYLLRIHAAARAIVAWENRHHDIALRLLREVAEKIAALPDLDNEVFDAERQRSLQALRELGQQISEDRPVSEIESLQRQLRQAVDAQEFEKAALLRDRLRALQDPKIAKSP